MGYIIVFINRLRKQENLFKIKRRIFLLFLSKLFYKIIIFGRFDLTKIFSFDIIVLVIEDKFALKADSTAVAKKLQNPKQYSFAMKGFSIISSAVAGWSLKTLGKKKNKKEENHVSYFNETTS